VVGYFVVQSLNVEEEEVTDDIDGDGIIDSEDNCPEDANASQSDIDDDDKGDVCDSKDDRPEDVVEPGPGVDTDSDGLTDVEEDLYGTDDRNPDSDGDSFLDGNEVFHRYSPLSTSGATLLDTGAVEEFVSSDEVFRFTHPTGWDVSEAVDPAEGVQEVVVSTNTNASFSIVITPAIETSFPMSIELLTKEGYVVYMSSDERTSVVVTDSFFYSFTYDLDDEVTVDFLQTFQMLINSFYIIAL